MIKKIRYGVICPYLSPDQRGKAENCKVGNILCQKYCMFLIAHDALNKIVVCNYNLPIPLPVKTSCKINLVKSFNGLKFFDSNITR